VDDPGTGKAPPSAPPADAPPLVTIHLHLYRRRRRQPHPRWV